MKPPPIRRHGFADQHMVVLPAPIRLSASRHPLLRQLLVTDAGYFPRASGHRVERPQGSSTHLVFVCLQGKGWVRRGGRTEAIAPGDVAWLPADQPHAYGSDPDSPWTIVWAHFSGAEAEAWMHELGWRGNDPAGPLHLASADLAELEFDRVFDALEHGYSVPQLLAASAALRATFCCVIRLTQQSGAPRSAAERTALVRAQLVRNPARSYRLSELATTAGLSVPHFSLLFRQQTGYAPIDFVIRQRIRAACRLLDTTPQSVTQIATEVGFSDPYYFSRAFRRVMGHSPSDYRRTVKA